MSSLKWTPQALTDIQRLWRFLAAGNPDAARSAVTEIRNSVRILATHPESGRPVDELFPYREWPVSFGNNGYIVLYRIDAATVTVLAVRNQREAGW